MQVKRTVLSRYGQGTAACPVAQGVFMKKNAVHISAVRRCRTACAVLDIIHYNYYTADNKKGGVRCA